MVKFFDLIKFKEIFDSSYLKPTRKPKLGHYLMMIGILMLLFIGFNRIWHFVYIRLDSILCGIFGVSKLPVASTFWRYIDSMGINQATSLLVLMSRLRERVWQVLGIDYRSIHIDIDTTVETIYGNQQGGRKGHNTKNRGKKAYRPVLCFVEETREYLAGKLRRGDTISGEECAAFIKITDKQIPSCVEKVLMRADGEFMSWDSVQACIYVGWNYIIANKGCNPPFDRSKWYRPWKRKSVEYNSCEYKPIGWGRVCRFVAMRIPIVETKPANQMIQCSLFEDENYKYRIFCTDISRPAHKVINEYDKRADVENLVGEAKREGLDAIPSAKFKNNYAFFQIVMLAYNIWRYLKIMGEESIKDQDIGKIQGQGLIGIKNNTIRIARLKMLMIAAKVVRDSNRDKVKISTHDSRTPGILSFLDYLDRLREAPIPWEKEGCFS